jgi:5-methylcytosine-specific restriction endonuclease McrA
MVLSPGELVPVLAGADVERIVFDGPSRVIDVGEARFFRGALRRAIEVRDRHCQHESGCDVPAERCEVDHIVPAGEGGPTTQENGRLLCGFHNRRRNERPPP